MIDKEPDLESHPLLPSGQWEGFYCYNHNPEQHRMATELTFISEEITGSGVDDVASFTWQGKYGLEQLKIKMTKSYATHQVFYQGDIDENGIWGTWELEQDFSQVPSHMVDALKRAMAHMLRGGFHIWPKAVESESAEAAAVESEKLKEIFTEEFTK